MLFEEYGLLDCITLPVTRHENRHVYNQYCIRVGDGKRDQVLAGLRERKLGCNVYYPKPLHLQTCFAELGYEPGSLPHAEQASRESLALPIFPELTEAQQERVVQGVAASLGRTPTRSLQNHIPRPKFLSTGVRAGVARSADVD
jgi:dTDP-4-amino-4,6-dideoxygalactose transaminase